MEVSGAYIETTKSGQLWNGNSWAFEMLSIIDQYLADESLEQVLPLDDSILVEIKKAESAITTVRKEIVKSAQDSKKVGELQAFENLFSHVALLTYHDPKETIDLIQELVDCCDLMLLPKKASTRAASKKRKVVEAADEASEKPAAIEVLVDILIGFLAKPSTLLRSLATGVFKVFVHEMTPKAISLIFDVLNAQSGVQGAAELFEDEQEEEGETTEQDSEDSDDADNASDDDDMAPVDPELVKQVQQVIGDGNSDEELEDMDDQEMTVFDEKLAQIFQQRKQLKTQQKETKQHVLHFKLRVLDFIDIYVKTNSQSAFLMDLLDPLVALYKDTCTSVDQKVLHDKVKTILLTKLVKAKDVPKLESAERCLAMLQDLHSDVRLGASAQTANFYSSLSLFLVKLVSHANTPVEAPRPKRSKKETESAAAPQLPNEERVCQIYLESFVNFLTDKKSMVRAGLFTEVVDRYPQYAPQLLLRMLAILSSTPEIKAFPLVTALTIVCHFVKRLQVDGEDTASMERFSAVIKQLSEVFVQILGMIPGSPAQGPYQFSKDRVKTCFKDLLNIYRYTKKPLQVHFMLIQTFPELKNTWDSAKIMELATLVVADDKFKSMGSLANLVKQLSALTTN